MPPLPLPPNHATQVRFIEYMPFDGNRWSAQRMMSFAEMLSHIQGVFPDVHAVEDEPHSTSKTFKVPGFTGTFGFITSMTKNFCSSCNRLRVTADGSLKVCLFGADETSLRDLMRRGGGGSGGAAGGVGDEELLQVIEAAVWDKKASLGGHKDMHEIANGVNRSMIRIGG